MHYRYKCNLLKNRIIKILFLKETLLIILLLNCLISDLKLNLHGQLKNLIIKIKTFSSVLSSRYNYEFYFKFKHNR